MVAAASGSCAAAVLWSPGGTAWIYVPADKRVRRLDAAGWTTTDVGGVGITPAQLTAAVCKTGDGPGSGGTFAATSTSSHVDPAELTVTALVNACK
jgi:hypothetical protein